MSSLVIKDIEVDNLDIFVLKSILKQADENNQEVFLDGTELACLRDVVASYDMAQVKTEMRLDKEPLDKSLSFWKRKLALFIK